MPSRQRDDGGEPLVLPEQFALSLDGGEHHRGHGVVAGVLLAGGPGDPGSTGSALGRQRDNEDEEHEPQREHKHPAVTPAFSQNAAIRSASFHVTAPPTPRHFPGRTIAIFPRMTRYMTRQGRYLSSF